MCQILQPLCTSAEAKRFFPPWVCFPLSCPNWTPDPVCLVWERHFISGALITSELIFKAWEMRKDRSYALGSVSRLHHPPPLYWRLWESRLVKAWIKHLSPLITELSFHQGLIRTPGGMGGSRPLMSVLHLCWLATLCVLWLRYPWDFCVCFRFPIRLLSSQLCSQRLHFLL